MRFATPQEQHRLEAAAEELVKFAIEHAQLHDRPEHVARQAILSAATCIQNAMGRRMPELTVAEVTQAFAMALASLAVQTNTNPHAVLGAFGRQFITGVENIGAAFQPQTETKQ